MPPNSDDICSRCAKIHWEDFRHRYDFREYNPVIEESAKKLEESNCRICQLLATIKSTGFGNSLKRTYPNQFETETQLYFAGAGKCSKYPGGTLDIIKLDFRQMSAIRSDGDPRYVNLGTVRVWMEKCSRTHGAPCTPESSSSLEGLRVIDCYENAIVTPPRDSSYLALSYVWGPSEDYKEPTTYPYLPQRLPRTIEDAITATLRLRYKYLWVDRYCINQQDPKDMHSQIAQMGQIYASAQLTLVAAAGTNPKYGLAGVDIPRRSPIMNYAVVGDVGLVRSPEPASSLLSRSVWASRAWTFQEGYLSKHRLFFTDSQMIFVCNRDVENDTIFDATTRPGSLKWDVDFLPPVRRPSYHRIVSKSPNLVAAVRYMEAYSLRSLTYETDALDAIVGILNTLASDPKDRVYHIWGVPLAAEIGRLCPKLQETRSDELALNWFHLKPGQRRVGFPSWSSLGWSSGVEIYYHFLQPIIPKDFEVSIEHGGEHLSLSAYIENGFIRSHSGQKDAPALLTVSANIFRIELASVDEATWITLPLSSEYDVHHQVHWDQTAQTISPADTLLGLVTASQPPKMAILVLERRGECYERVGFVEFGPNVWGVSRTFQKSSSQQHVEEEAIPKGCLERPLFLEQATRQTIVLG